ncbi:MAG: hypothetical protein ACRCV0_00885 [Brevinema sp.]
MIISGYILKNGREELANDGFVKVYRDIFYEKLFELNKVLIIDISLSF